METAMTQSAITQSATTDRVTIPAGGSMLPGDKYTSADVLAWERRHLFAGAWTCLGRTAELRAGVTHRAVTAGDVGVLLTFPVEGARAYANVCRHRGHELLPE